MIPIEKPNPFKVLELPTDAVNKTIVAKNTELTELAESEELTLQYRSATEELITHPMIRLEFELFEIPETKYENPEWERFVRSFRRNPVNLNSLAKEVSPPGINDFNLEAIISIFLDSMIAIKRADVKAAVERLPFKAGNGMPLLEVRDVIFG